MTVLPPLAMTGVTVAVGLLIGRGIYMLMSVSATGMAVVFSIVKYFNDRQERKEKMKPVFNATQNIYGKNSRN